MEENLKMKGKKIIASLLLVASSATIFTACGKNNSAQQNIPNMTQQVAPMDVGVEGRANRSTDSRTYGRSVNPYRKRWVHHNTNEFATRHGLIDQNNQRISNQSQDGMREYARSRYSHNRNNKNRHRNRVNNYTKTDNGMTQTNDTALIQSENRRGQINNYRTDRYTNNYEEEQDITNNRISTTDDETVSFNKSDTTRDINESRQNNWNNYNRTNRNNKNINKTRNAGNTDSLTGRSNRNNRDRYTNRRLNNHNRRTNNIVNNINRTDDAVNNVSDTNNGVTAMPVIEKLPATTVMPKSAVNNPARNSGRNVARAERHNANIIRKSRINRNTDDRKQNVTDREATENNIAQHTIIDNTYTAEKANINNIGSSLPHPDTWGSNTNTTPNIVAKNNETKNNIVSDVNNNQTRKFYVNYINGTKVTRETVSQGGIVSNFDANPTADNQTFGGWFIDSNYTTPFDQNAPINSNMNVYAKWSA